MDYMMELAGYSDIPEALDRLTKRHRIRTGRTPAATQKSFRTVPDSPKVGDNLFEAPPPEPLTNALENPLRKLSASREQNLLEDHPNTWLAEVVYQFYAVPQLAADAWSELRYCRQFRHRLADDLAAAHRTAEGERTQRQQTLVDTTRDCMARNKAGHIRPNILEGEHAASVIESALKRDDSRMLIDALANDAAIWQSIPPFIERLVDDILVQRMLASTPAVSEKVRQAVTTVSSLTNDIRKRSLKEAFKNLSDERTRAQVEDRIVPLLARTNEVRRLLGNPAIVTDEARRLGLPVPFTLALDAELGQIRTTRQLNGSRQAATGEDTRKLSPHRKAFDDRLVGLALSGGGIRSATFNLGVLQSLASNGVLQHCDYLSTVSGGGYIGSWLSAWVHRRVGKGHEAAPSRREENARNGLKDVYRRLSPFRHSDPIDARVRPIRYLREFSNYLTPRTGFLSADTWTMVGIYLRNTLLNQIILTTLFAGLLLLPRNVFQWWDWLDDAGPGIRATLVPWIIAGLYVSAAYFLIKNLGRLDPYGSETRVDKAESATPALEVAMPGYARPWVVQVMVVGLSFLATSLALHHFFTAGLKFEAWGWRWLRHVQDSTPSFPYYERWILYGIAVGLCTWTILFFGGSLRCWLDDRGRRDPKRWRRGRSILILTSVVCGATASGLTWCALWLVYRLPDEGGAGRPWHSIALAAPVMMAVCSLVIVVQLGMLGDDFPDEHREWWSRLRSHVHMESVGWLLWFTIAIYLPWGFHVLTSHQSAIGSSVAAVLAWLGSTIFGIRGAQGATTSPRPGAAGPPPGATRVAMQWFTAAAPYVFVIGLMAGLSLVIDRVFWVNATSNATPPTYWHYATGTATGWRLFVSTVGCFGVCLLFSWRVDVNDFSMHHFYKNRLVRCYLGASRADERKADWLTGFDPADDVRLSAFDHGSEESAEPPTTAEDAREDSADRRPKYPGPYPLLNAALNLVGGNDLAWQERKAESFVFTPKYCGYDLDRAVFTKLKDGKSNASEAYIPTRQFYRDGAGPLLGMAMAISGAAANPNMGRATDPASAFLMTVFNARLGWWIGNTRNKENAKKPGPPLGLTYTLAELTGSTTDESAFVNLSDGGHFDNLGVYELIRRGCRYIIACDAGQDGKVIGEDLGDLVRRCRTDFNVDIDISIERIHNRTGDGLSYAHCVVGKIHYLNVPKRNSKGILVNEDGRPFTRGDRPAHEVGYLIYLKPSITGDEPHDIVEYHSRVDAFPHESTADQWFGESQFEAYRKLGMHIGEQVFKRYQNDDSRMVADVGQLFERLYRFWYPPTLTIASHSTQHTKTYTDIMERVRQATGLEDLDHTVFDGLPPNITKSLKPRDEFYLCSALIQLMEDVYADLNLEHNWDHPHVEGWMSVFRRWAQQDAFKRTWASSSASYAERFRHFLADRLLNAQRRPLILGDNFIVAHRGLWRRKKADPRLNVLDQNTLKAFRAAASATGRERPDAVELDVQRLKCGELVVFHDPEIDRHPVIELTFAEFDQALKTVANRERLDPVLPLTFSNCLRDLDGRMMKLDVEIKTTGAEADVLRALRDAAWSPDDFVVTSFDEPTLMNIRAIRADVQIGCLIEGAMDTVRVKTLRAIGVDFIGPRVTTLYSDYNNHQLNDAFLNEVAKTGIALVPWVEDDPARIRQLLADPAIVGVITDDVAAAAKARKEIR